MTGTEQREPRELVAEVERLLEEVERLPDPTASAIATGMVQALLELYGAGLGRIVEELAARADGELARALADDELVAHLLLLHGLHPVAVEDRVIGALAEVRPYLESHGGNVELLAVQDGVVRLRLEGSCKGCPSSRMTLKLAIENAIHKAAPEIEQVIAEEEPEAPASLLQIEIAPGMGGEPAAGSGYLAAGGLPEPTGSWAMVGGLPELREGGILVKPVAGTPIMFLRIGASLYGYQPHCPACGGSLQGAALAGVELTCPGCASRYDALRAGRCLDSPQLHLEPVPLLVGSDSLVKVALPAAA